MKLTQIKPTTPSSLGMAAPECLISKVGKVVFGQFDGPVAALGIENFSYVTNMDKPASSLSKYLDFKQFQFVSIVTPEYIVAVAIADIRYLGSAFCYFYDIKNDELIETQWLKLGSFGYQMSHSPMDGVAYINSRKGEVKFIIEQGCWHLEVKTARLVVNVDISPQVLSLPIAMCTPTGYNGWTYTQKHNGLNVVGSLSIDNKVISLEKALANYDFSAGFMRRETSWRWGSINAHFNGSIIGLNLASGVNETGTNENVFWFNGERHPLSPVHFDFSYLQRSGSDLLAQNRWRLYSEDACVDLIFTIKNLRREKINLLFIKSNFRQYLGYYTGTIIDNSGRVHKLNNVIGLAEDHYAKW
ncbi:DUF2804 domain-containing protein [Shewanella surugensis]|uniref:DUF2804 domain-containing protein n=1 Tax=Shewanella surugensis TaxID=212020 RepID=A0ABT0LC66_9GAMM|nr:DUF2804 domain-containing protein [Shewanella surugensis]MCL1125299.1 DUF2804 domain-containing protein [Shewanella surugensis]